MEIKIYITPSCLWCKKTKEWLKKKKLSFQECDISESQNSAYRDELLEKSGQLAVPVTDIDGFIVVGFDEARLEEAVKKAKEKLL